MSLYFRNSTAFKSMEEKVGGAVANVKVRIYLYKCV